MKSNFELIMSAASLISLLITLSMSLVLCGAGQQDKSSKLSQSSSHEPLMSISRAAEAASEAKVAHVISSSPSSPDDLKRAALAGNGEELDGLRGRRAFTEDSLWQIPVALFRDLTSASNGGSDIMHNSASVGIRSLKSNKDDKSAVFGPPKISTNLQPLARGGSESDLKAAAGYHYPTHHHHDEHHHAGYESHGAAPAHHGAQHYGAQNYGKYFQYANVPHPNAYEFGYRRGNPLHTIERYEHKDGPHFQTKVKWSDKHGGYGVHVWDYNHDDHHAHHHDHHDHYDHHGHYPAPQHGHYDAHAGHHYGHGPAHYG